MQREIRFRAWDVDKKQMMFNVPYDITNVMQFTGLKDKNGKEIYEGDIVESDNEIKYSVVWNEKRCWWGVKHKSSEEGFSLDVFGAENSEIIGNIYENPELLTPLS